MIYFTFISYQILLFSILFIVNVFANEYISPPFSYVDAIAALLSLPIHFLVLDLIIKLYKKYSFSIRKNVLLSILSFLLAFLFIALLENIWFELTGKMLF
jgi:hypothetical protein